MNEWLAQFMKEREIWLLITDEKTYKVYHRPTRQVIGWVKVHPELKETDWHLNQRVQILYNRVFKIRK